MTPQEKIIYDALSLATKAKQLVRFLYQDTTDKNNRPQWRTVEPHLIGLRRLKDISKQTIQLSGWVRLNATDNMDEIMDGKSDGWKTYKLFAISKLQVLDAVYQRTRPNYNPNDLTMAQVYCNTLKVL
jgi:hypothetical protein